MFKSVLAVVWRAIAVEKRPGASNERIIYPARPAQGTVNYDALRVSVMKRISKARAYLAAR